MQPDPTVSVHVIELPGFGVGRASPVNNQGGEQTNARKRARGARGQRSRRGTLSALLALPSQLICGRTLHVWDTLPLTGCAASPGDRQDEIAAD